MIKCANKINKFWYWTGRESRVAITLEIITSAKNINALNDWISKTSRKYEYILDNRINNRNLWKTNRFYYGIGNVKYFNVYSLKAGWNSGEA